MARQRDPKRDQAFEIWKSCSGQKDLVEIAAELDLPPGTIRGWKAKDKWGQKLNGMFQKKKDKKAERSNKNTERSKRKAETKGKSPPNDVQIEDVTENLDLTPMQRLFVYEYTVDFNATQAAKRAGYSPDSAHVQGPRLLENVRVQKAIENLVQQRLVTVDLSANQIVEQYKKIAFADIRDVVEWNMADVCVGLNLDNEPIMDRQLKIEIRPSDDVDGTIISEVSETVGKNGPTHTVKLNDRMKALDFLAKYMNIISDREKRRMDELKLEIELEKLKMAREKLAIEKERLELEKSKVEDGTDDGPIEIVIKRKGEGT